MFKNLTIIAQTCGRFSHTLPNKIDTTVRWISTKFHVPTQLELGRGCLNRLVTSHAGSCRRGLSTTSIQLVDGVSAVERVGPRSWSQVVQAVLVWTAERSMTLVALQ